MKKSSSAFFIATPVIIITVLLFSAINYLFYESITPNKFGSFTTGESIQFQPNNTSTSVNIGNQVKAPVSVNKTNKFNNINNYRISNDYNYQIDLTKENDIANYQTSGYMDETTNTSSFKRNRNIASNAISTNMQSLGINLNLKKLSRENQNQLLADNSSFAGTSLLDGPAINKAAPPTEADPTATVPVGNGLWLLILGIIIYAFFKFPRLKIAILKR
jgi:hypothetical protein